MTDSPIERLIHQADLPPGVVVIAAPVEPGEVLPGETVPQALARLNRVAVIHATDPERRND